MTETKEQTREIKARIEIARQLFVKLKKFLCCRDLKLNLTMLCLLQTALWFGGMDT